MPRLSLRFRILLLTLCVETVTLIAFGAVSYHRSRRQLLDALDDVLRDETETLASFVESEIGSDLSKVDAVARARSRFAGLRRRDLYQVTLPDGRSLVKSSRLGDGSLAVPYEQAKDLEIGKSFLFDIEWRSDRYRARLLRAVSGDGTAEKSSPAGGQEFFVMVAKPRQEMNNRLNDILLYVASIGAVVLCFSSIAFWILVRWGLSPVTRLSAEVEAVAPRNLEYRVDGTRLPRDLRTLGVSINGFIERLEKAFAHEKQFVADAAHELCTPIALLKSNIQSALLGPPDSAGDRRSLEELLNDVERLEHLSNSLLALSEAEAGQAGLENREEIELQPYLRSLAGQFEQAAHQREVSLQVANTGDDVVRADRTALDRVFGNLIDNAIKHNQPGANVTLAVHQDEAGCEVWVSDDGPGLPAEDASRLFERFFRVDTSRSRERGGAGLGLAIVKSLCESQGAEVFYRAREPQGSVFVVRFPRA